MQTRPSELPKYTMCPLSASYSSRIVKDEVRAFGARDQLFRGVGGVHQLGERIVQPGARGVDNRSRRHRISFAGLAIGHDETAR